MECRPFESPRGKSFRRNGTNFGFTQQQPAPWTQCLMKSPNDRPCNVWLEIDRHVAKQDQVQAKGTVQRRRIDVFHEIQIGKTNPVPDSRNQAIRITLSLEIVDVPMHIGLPKRPRSIASLASTTEKAGVEISAKN